MIHLLFLAQMAGASPPPATATPVPSRTAVASPTATPAVGSSARSVSSAPKTLADVARERKLGAKGVEGGTLSVAGTSGPPERPVPESAASGRSDSPDRDRIRAARAAVQAARRELDEVAARAGMTSEETAAKRARLLEARRKLEEAYNSPAPPKQ